MELMFNIFLMVSILAFLGVVSFVVVSIIHSKNAENEVEKNIKLIKGIIQAFIRGEVDLSQHFMKLVKLGYFTSFRMGNHGGEFNYNRQLEDFRKFNTSKMSDALRRVGERYERYNI